MIDKRTIFEIYRLKNQGFSGRRISRELGIARTIVAKYLQNPVKTTTVRKKHSKLDDFSALIDQLIKDNPAATAKFLQHALRRRGFTGKTGIYSDYLRKRRPQVLSNNCREINLYMIKGDLYRCMIKGISYLDVLRGSFWKDPNMKQPMLNEEERQTVIRNGRQGNHKTWRYAVAVDMSGLGFGTRRIAKILDMSRGTIRRAIKAYMEQKLSRIPKKRPHPKRVQERSELKRKRVREMNLDMIRGKLYRCMIKGISYLDVLRSSFWNNPNMERSMLSEEERQAVIRNGRQGDHKTWRYAVAVDISGLGFGIRRISKILDISRGTIRRAIKAYTEQGLSGIPRKKPNPNSAQERSELKRKRVIEILHQKPRSFRINRSNWSQPSIAAAYKEMYGEPISTSTIGDLIRKSGYSIRKARRVLTSPDPDYVEKVELLLAKLHSLKSDEVFFFIDEIGPMQVKKYGGRTYVKKGEIKSIPQIQNSKGTIISSAALSATTNQLTWLFAKSKDTSSMMDLIEILFDQYQEKTRLFITWDAASWHSSRNLVDWLDKFNNKTKETGKSPLIEFIPLPNRSQFLNVIEAVFSGMKRAVIHHSNYQSEDEMKAAISRHFQDRNDYFKANPRRAGKKIWEIDFFQDYDNLRSGNYREW